jgi:hypothetical protein
MGSGVNCGASDNKENLTGIEDEVYMPDMRDKR